MKCGAVLIVPSWNTCQNCSKTVKKVKVTPVKRIKKDPIDTWIERHRYSTG